MENLKLAIEKKEFGKTKDGFKIEQYTLTNSNGLELKVITYGGRITSLKVPNRDAKLENVVLGFDAIEDYENDAAYLGALIGRFSNRIANGKFSISGNEYVLATNDGLNHLHGGLKGFDSVVWKATPIEDEECPALQLCYLSKDGDEGYPGNLNVKVTYTLNKENALEVSYEATTDKTTVVNLTQHSYFNLTGNFSKNILDHDIVINSESFLPVDNTSIPKGTIQKVLGTPFDFSQPKRIGKEIDGDDEQLQLGKGYDHSWIVNDKKGQLRFVASAFDRSSGRLLEVFSKEPALQFYTGNFLDDSVPISKGKAYGYRTRFSLETH